MLTEAQEDNVLVKQGKRRQSIFFSVITKFAMKHSLKEIERYYASKAKRSPHVVGHYAAGARVTGLTDKELRKTWKELSHASKGLDSPYAQPLNFVVDHDDVKRKKKRVRPKGSGGVGGGGGGGSKTNALAAPKRTYMFRLKSDAKSESPENRGGGKEESPDNVNDESNSPTTTQSLSDVGTASPSSVRSSSPAKSVFLPGSTPEKRDGWTPRHRLPITKVKLPKFTYPQEKKLTIRDMGKIRQRVNDARNTYYTHLSEEKVNKAKEYWKSLKTEQIPSERLQTNFRKVFNCYSPTNDKEYRCASSTASRSRTASPISELRSFRSDNDFIF